MSQTQEALREAKAATVPVVKTRLLSHGTMEIKDMAASRKFYTEFLGLDCVRHNKPAMMIRKGGYWAIVCVQVGEAARPQQVLNHWGLDVGSIEEVDDAHRKALELKDTYGIKKITTPGHQHGAYSFYIEDLDSNWWEIQYVPEHHHDTVWAKGDVIPMD
jgi:predicted lactoylglutathione lyase